MIEELEQNQIILIPVVMILQLKWNPWAPKMLNLLFLPTS